MTPATAIEMVIVAVICKLTLLNGAVTTEDCFDESMMGFERLNALRGETFKEE